MSARVARLIARFSWTLSITFVLASLPLIIANRDSPLQNQFGSFSLELVFVIFLSSLPTVGAIVASRQPENTIGWLLLAAGLLYEFTIFANEYATYSILTVPGSLPGGARMAWASSTWSWTPGLGILAALFMLFPSGRLPAPRWRLVLWGVVLSTATLTVGYAFRPGPYDPPWNFVRNPYAPSGLLGDVAGALASIGSILTVVALLLGATSLLVRFHRAHGVERQQLKWLAYTASLFALYIPIAITFSVVVPIPSLYLLISAVGILIFMTIPLAAGFAVLRYRLYDIDLLINRTVVYGVTSAGIAVTFFLGIVALQAVLQPITSGSEFAIAASTLVSFALFQPIRRRVQDAVDRRFDRSRYDAARMLDSFADRLRDEVDLDALRGELLHAVHSTMAPAHASLWLRERGR